MFKVGMTINLEIIWRAYRESFAWEPCHMFILHHVPNRVAANPHFFLAADLVALPSFSDLVTVLMTPTATVWRMSRTAKRPSGG